MSFFEDLGDAIGDMWDGVTGKTQEKAARRMERAMRRQNKLIMQAQRQQRALLDAERRRIAAERRGADGSTAAQNRLAARAGGLTSFVDGGPKISRPVDDATLRSRFGGA